MLVKLCFKELYKSKWSALCFQYYSHFIGLKSDKIRPWFVVVKEWDTSNIFCETRYEFICHNKWYKVTLANICNTRRCCWVTLPVQHGFKPKLVKAGTYVASHEKKTDFAYTNHNILEFFPRYLTLMGQCKLGSLMVYNG